MRLSPSSKRGLRFQQRSLPQTAAAFLIRLLRQFTCIILLSLLRCLATSASCALAIRAFRCSSFRASLRHFSSLLEAPLLPRFCFSLALCFAGCFFFPDAGGEVERPDGSALRPAFKFSYWTLFCKNAIRLFCFGSAADIFLLAAGSAAFTRVFTLSTGSVELSSVLACAARSALLVRLMSSASLSQCMRREHFP